MQADLADLQGMPWHHPEVEHHPQRTHHRIQYHDKPIGPPAGAAITSQEYLQ